MDQREATLNAILIDRRWDQVAAESKRRAKKVGKKQSDMQTHRHIRMKLLNQQITQ
jgi:hypothetical protein